MVKRKKPDKRKYKKRASFSKALLHRDAEYTRKIIQSHPSVNGEVGVPRSFTNGGFDINFDMSVPLPSRSNKTRISETGVQSNEPIIFRFPPSYPFQAPKILLRPDFNRLLPHINPIIRSDAKGFIVPCVYDGPLDDLLHQEGDGLSEILNQLAGWLAQAAIDDLTNSKQGWEPIRRDDMFGWIVYDLSGLRSRIQNKEGALVFQCRFWEWKELTEKLYFAGGIDHHKQQDITPWLIKNSFFVDKRFFKPSYVSLMIFAWSNSDVLADQYLPENTCNLSQIYENAKKYGCYDSLISTLINLGWAIKESSIGMSVFPLFVTLCARRPFKLIGDDSYVELIPYIVQCHVEDTQLSFPESAIRFRKDSPAFPLGHRHAMTSKLLKTMSGGRDKMKDGPIVHLGCGSVGSKIAMHLARSGHGPFKLIDQATFSPHNAARHALMPIPEIPGQPKATFLAKQIKMLQAEADPYNYDITELCRTPDMKKLVFPNDTRLVIESTGSMAVRELLADMSLKKLYGRLLHVALYESGKVGIMALEGNNRNPNVCDLVIRFWDERIDDHDIRSNFQTPSNGMSRQEVGLGCGSHTLVMPDTRISLYAAGIAERARQFIEGDITQSGELWIGTLQANELQVSWRLVELGQTKVLNIKAKNEWQIRILKQALDQISKEVEKYEEIETGGVLIGRISLTRRCFTISRVIEATPDSKRSPSLFVLGTQGLKKQVKEIHDKSGGFLSYVGTWHSHPKGGEPSALDRDSFERMKRHRFGAPAVSLIWTPSRFKTIIDEGKLS